MSEFGFQSSGSGGGGGGSSIIVLGAGCGSSVRCGNNNTASGLYTSIFGLCNTGIGLRSTISGGIKGLNNSIDGFIGGGNCNSVCNSISGCLALGAVVVGGVGNNTAGGTWSLASCCFTVSPTICSTGQFSFVGGGFQNQATQFFSAVTGGCCNISNGTGSFVGGGRGNKGLAQESTLSGGLCNCIASPGNNASTIGGGSYNFINVIYSDCGFEPSWADTISGGTGNCIFMSQSGYNPAGIHTISGGAIHRIIDGIGHNISGGEQNTISSRYHSGISSGKCQTVSGYYSNISGGTRNVVSGSYGFIGGGQLNTASGREAAIMGGSFQTASGLRSIIVGGCKNLNNSIDGFIGGGNCNNVCNSTSGCLAYGAIVVGGVGNNTFGGTWSLVSCCFTSNPTICNVGQYSFIGGGLQNISSGCFSGVLGGQCNNVALCANTFIVGSCITADRPCATFVNNLSIKTIPTSSAGLPSGAVWRCITDNTLRIIP
jgi:hypothetical protein